LSARAAAQLELKGFTEVYQYVRGKADWMVRGLPSEPAAPIAERLRALPYFVHNLAPAIRQRWIELSHRRGVAQSMLDDLPHLRPGDPLPSSFKSGAPPFAVVLDGAGILLGAIETIRPGLAAEGAMNPAPQTIRPDMTHALAKTLLRHAPYLLITEADGRYLGRYKEGLLLAVGQVLQPVVSSG
jgi:hypothetical protein